MPALSWPGPTGFPIRCPGKRKTITFWRWRAAIVPMTQERIGGDAVGVGSCLPS